MKRPMQLQKNTFDRASSAGEKFTHSYIRYQSLGFNREQGKFFCQQILGKGEFGEPREFVLKSTKNPRTIREDYRMYR